MKKSLALFLLPLHILLFSAACVPQRSQMPPVTETAAMAATTAPVESQSPSAPADTPAPTEEPIANTIRIPAEWKDALTAEGPDDLNLDGSLSWIWTKNMSSSGQLAAMYSMCAAVTGRYSGKDCVYAGPVHRSWNTPIYTAGNEYPNIKSISGAGFSVYFVEHNDTSWRLMYLPLDSKPDQAVIVDEGAGTAPVLSAHTETTLAYAMHENNAWIIRIREKISAEEYAKAAESGAPLTVGQILADIPLGEEPLEPNRSYAHNAERGVTYALPGHSIVTQDMEGETAVYDLDEMPLLAQANDWCLAWMDESANLYAYLFETGERYLLGTDVAWFDVSRDILFADQNASRLIFAGRMADDESLAILPIAAGNYKYTACTTFTMGETYALILRERGGAVEFAGMDMMLKRAE